MLHQHKEEFRGKITSYQGDITTENKKLAMINETTQYLDEQLEKLRRKTGTHKWGLKRLSLPVIYRKGVVQLNHILYAVHT